MLVETVVIQNKLGLHARASSVFVKKACEFAANVTVVKESRTANGKSIMSMMKLEAPVGTSLELQVDGEDEDLSLAALVNLVEQRFGEDE